MRFSHIADTHLGAFKDPILRELNVKAFESAIEQSIEKKVDFIIISGDLFHNPIPDMNVVDRAVKSMKKAKDKHIEICVIYGSHDFSRGSKSLMDIITTAGIFENVSKIKGEEKFRLEPTIIKDVKIVGMPGLSGGLESKYYENLDRKYLESLPGQKIFVFHTTLSELKPSYLTDKNSTLISYLPKGFDYYAGGHIHENMRKKTDKGWIIYPGVLFGSNYRDLENSAEKGFYIVENFEPDFIPIKVAEFERKNINADGKTAEELKTELMKFAKKDHSKKIVMLKIKGMISSGRVSDIDFSKVREKISETALTVQINRYGLTTKDITEIKIIEDEDIENKMLGEMGDEFGHVFAGQILKILKCQQVEDENKKVYEERIWNNTYELLKKQLEGKRLDSKKETLFDFS